MLLELPFEIGTELPFDEVLLELPSEFGIEFESCKTMGLVCGVELFDASMKRAIYKGAGKGKRLLNDLLSPPFRMNRTT